MRAASILVAGMAVLAGPAVAEPAPPATALDNPAYSQPAKQWSSVDEAVADGTVIELPGEVPMRIRNLEECRDTINKARADNGLPPLLDREPASPDKPLAIYAVDRRQDGCSVMVMKGNPDDIRPLPAPMEGPARVLPAQGADGEE